MAKLTLQLSAFYIWDLKTMVTMRRLKMRHGTGAQNY